MKGCERPVQQMVSARGWFDPGAAVSRLLARADARWGPPLVRVRDRRRLVPARHPDCKWLPRNRASGANPKTRERGYADGTIGGDTPRCYTLEAAGEGRADDGVAEIFPARRFQQLRASNDRFALALETWKPQAGRPPTHDHDERVSERGPLLRASRFTPGRQPDYLTSTVGRCVASF